MSEGRVYTGGYGDVIGRFRDGSVYPPNSDMSVGSYKNDGRISKGTYDGGTSWGILRGTDIMTSDHASTGLHISGNRIVDDPYGDFVYFEGDPIGAAAVALLLWKPSKGGIAG